VVRTGLSTVPTIGCPIAGTFIYVLDEHGRLVTKGETGEIYIGGAGVGRGYRNLPTLTAQSFVPDSFSSVVGARMYRTGDRGVLLPDGQIDFRGRLDGQEKIRGQRVELDEINIVLNRHPSVVFGVVVASTERKSDKQLIAYVLLAEATKPSSLELQEYLSKTLPAYMIPAVFVRLDSIPLTVNGKLNRLALMPPTPENSLSKDGTRDTLSPTEERLIGMVRELLSTNEVTIEDDFFLIGGHSLLGTQLVLRIREAFGIEFTLRDLFEAATVERLAMRVESMLIAELIGLSEEEAVRQIRS
jgi:acyl carrier protein